MAHNNCKDTTGWKTCWEEGVISYIYLQYTGQGRDAPGGQSDQMKEIEAEQKAACAIEYDCDYPADMADHDGEDLYGTMVDDTGTDTESGYTGEHGGKVDGDQAKDSTALVTDDNIPLYEYWEIGYLTSTVDSNGLVVDNNFTLNYGTYIVLTADGDIYDAATFKGNVGTRGETAEESEISSIDPYLVGNMLTDEELDGISSFQIRQVLYDHTEDEYFIVNWAYGDTSRPVFQTTSEADEYTIEYNGDKGPIKDTYRLTKGITGFKNSFEEFVVDIVNSVIGTAPSITEPTYNFKKVKRDKINFENLSVFRQPESGVIAESTATTSTTSTAAITSTTTVTGY